MLRSEAQRTARFARLPRHRRLFFRPVAGPARLGKRDPAAQETDHLMADERFTLKVPSGYWDMTPARQDAAAKGMWQDAMRQTGRDVETGEKLAATKDFPAGSPLGTGFAPKSLDA